LFEEDHSGTSKEVTKVFIDIAQEERQLKNGRNSAKVIEWLLEQSKSSKRPHQRNARHSPDLRAAFAGHLDPSKVVEARDALLTTLEQMKTASGDLNVDRRCTAVEDVRSRLITLASVTLPASCGQPLPARGLWSRIDFEPFYYLAVADAIMTESGCSGDK
jgi:hypothetical protein